MTETEMIREYDQSGGGGCGSNRTHSTNHSNNLQLAPDVRRRLTISHTSDAGRSPPVLSSTPNDLRSPHQGEQIHLLKETTQPTSQRHKQQQQQQVHSRCHKTRHKKMSSIRFNRREYLRRENPLNTSFITVINMRAKSLLHSLVLLSLLLTVLITSHERAVNGLDSPMKIQRNKQQLIQQQQQQVASNSSSSNPQVLSTSSSIRNSINDSVAPTVASVRTSVDRVRRTNSEQSRQQQVAAGSPSGGSSQSSFKQAPQQTPGADHQHDCPPSRLFQSLLPPEYSGSPAQSQRPGAPPRAYCECQPDGLGWHLTCYPSSSLFPARGSSGGPSNQATAAAAAAAMPNQLHPAFRAPQMARQQQQQAASRRNRRWSDDGSGEMSMSSEAETMSPHEGFGEESSPATTTTTTTTTTAKPRQQIIKSAVMNNLTTPIQHNRRQQSSSDSNHNQQDNDDDDDLMNSIHYNEIRANNQSRQHSNSNDKLALAASSNHLTFQTAPILFSIRYLRNTMIEIDCDQAAPHYKAAMFQGFNVNDVSSFTFNRCQLPNISFAVLLHRTGGGGKPQQQQQQQVAAAPAGPANKIQSVGVQSLKPNTRQRFQAQQGPQQNNFNLLSRRRRQSPDNESDVAGEQQPQHSTQQPRHHQQAAGSRDPKVRSLVVNFSTVQVVDQRTLISLLTGLDSLEELRLNYVQLNVTNFIQSDLNDQNLDPIQGDSTTTTTTSSASSILADNQTQQPRGTTTTTTTPVVLLSVAASNQQQQTTTARLAAAPPTTTSTTTTSTSTTTTSTTTSTTTTTTTPAPPSTSTPLITTTTTTMPSGQLKPFKQRQHQSVITSTSLASSTSTSSSSSSSSSSPAAATTNNHNHHQSTRPAIQSFSSTATRPPISMGAPRGLMIAQATGLPPTTGASVTSPLPLTTTTSGTATTTTTVPSISLMSVTSSINQQAALSQATQQPPTTTTTQTSQRNQQQQQQQTNNPNLISVGTSQTQSVSYANSNPINQPMRAAPPTASGITTTTTAASSSSPSSSSSHLPPTTSSLLSSSTAAAGSASSRLHQAPTGWLASSSSTPPAGSRLSNPTSMGAETGLTMAPQTTGWSQSGMGTTSSTSSPPSSGLSAPANTPSFGIRTQPQTIRTTTRLAATTRQQPQPAATTTTTTSSGNSQPTEGQFVAAGNRLRQRLPVGGMSTIPTAGQRFQAPTTTRQQQPELLSSSTIDFGASSLAPTTSASASGAGAAVAPPDDMESGRERTRRRKRYASQLEEFELSFGELLPSLKVLKLELFLDLSSTSKSAELAKRQRVVVSMQANNNNNNANNSQGRRFKRQFDSADMPEKDLESAADGDDDVASNESSRSNRLSSSSVAHQDADDQPSHPDRDVDIEPGETLWRSASETDFDRAPRVVVAPAQPPADLQEAEQSQPSNKQRRLAQLLVKMFSRLNQLKVLQLSSNDLPHWPDNVLWDSRHSLVRLYLISNNIRSLGARSFGQLTELQSLDMSSNQLRQLDANLFRDLVNLRHLRVRQNLFRKLPLKLMSRAASPKLDSVDFGRNRFLTQFTYSDSNNFNLAPLTSFNLSDCALSDQLVAPTGTTPANKQQANAADLVVQLFASMPEVTSISLNNNRLVNLLNQPSLFGKNYKLQRLDLSHNQLQQMHSSLFNRNASQLHELNLRFNQLEQIPRQVLFDLRELRRLHLAHNKLTQLPVKMFETNRRIELIDLSHNQLHSLETHESGTVPFGLAANLQQVHLAHNNLSDFKRNLFDINWTFYTNLQLLDCSHNHFRGPIQMPVFEIISNELSFNLEANSIQSINMDDLLEREQSHELLSAAELAPSAGRQPDEPAIDRHQQQVAKVPTVNVRLSQNPIACDCLLEPLYSYIYRVTSASNPSLVNSIFAPNQHQATSSPASAASLPASSRYSFLSSSEQSSTHKQPQVVYQFNKNEIHCARPRHLQRRPLSHISPGDLLCPINDRRLCPAECECHYQSAFKRAIVDCSGRQLTSIPSQLTEAANFLAFDVQINGLEGEEETLVTRPINNVDKVLIKLDNNQLTSMDELSSLFQVSAASQQHQEKTPNDNQREAHQPDVVMDSPNSLINERTSRVARRAEHNRQQVVAPTADQWTAPAQAASLQNNANNTKKKISPAMIARSMQTSASSEATTRTRRQVVDMEMTQPAPNSAAAAAAGDDELSFTNSMAGESAEVSSTSSSLGAISADEETNNNNNNNQPLSSSSPGVMSTAVLESAEEFRTKRYSLTCELYLDHNSISELPDSFLSQLDQVRLASIESARIPPQSALPTLMLEPPVHMKLNHLSLINSPPPPAAQPFDLLALDGVGDELAPVASGGHRRVRRHSLTPERKAALLETINQNIRLNKLQQSAPAATEQTTSTIVTVTPTLVALSLKYNNLGNIKAKMLQRLTKLIKASNTKLYFGHNPFNCTDNFSGWTDAQSAVTFNNNNNIDASPSDHIHSPIGDQLMASSDPSSGAYLEAAPEQDLNSAASEQSSAAVDSASGATQQTVASLTPVDCPVGQLKTWLTRHYLNVGDLDDIYCVHLPADLSERLKLLNSTSSLLDDTAPNNKTSDKLRASSATQHDHHQHPWTSSALTSASASALMGATATAGNSTGGHVLLHKKGVSWDAELLSATAKLIDLDLYDVCPYSNLQAAPLAGFLSAGHQQALISVAILFILLSLTLLLMLIYFGDTQTILAFVYIHMNPIYRCLRLNEAHLDGDKLYDAFVSYSSEDRDIVMQLIEHLEGSPADGRQQQQLLMANGKGTDLDRSRDTLVTEADLNPAYEHTNNSQNNNHNVNMSGTLMRRSTSMSSSFQDLSTMSRSTSRIQMNSSPSASGLADSGGSTANMAATGGGGGGADNNKAYKLCIHERDWLPGHMISWNIVNSVQNSRRTILILSKDFIKSTWFKVEFHTAYYQMLEDKIDRLIVIVRGELPPKHELDKNLAFLLTTKTYLVWGEKWFWERLHYALPHRTSPPAIHLGASRVTSKPQPQPQQHHHHHHHHHPGVDAQKGPSLLTSAKGKSNSNTTLVMSNIGKDCSNLLLSPSTTTTANSPGNNNNNLVSSCSTSASSSTSSAASTTSSSRAPPRSASQASSFLSSGASSTNQLFGPGGQRQPLQMTTSNDLLSTANNTSAIQLNVGAGQTTTSTANSSSTSTISQQQADSGRVTATLSSSQSIGVGAGAGAGGASGNVTSILLDGTSGANGGAQSRLRAKKQERLQNFVDKEIANQFNLSEL